VKNSKKVKKIGQILTICPILVPLAGLEPARMLLRGILRHMRQKIAGKTSFYEKCKNGAFLHRKQLKMPQTGKIKLR